MAEGQEAAAAALEKQTKEKKLKEDTTMARKNQPCDMDCLNCTRPAHRCYGGSKGGSMKIARYHKMTDGKRGEGMPDIAFGRGGKKEWR